MTTNPTRYDALDAIGPEPLANKAARLAVNEPPPHAALIAQIAAALSQLEKLGIDVQMPATFNGGGVRTDSGTIAFERYDDGARLGEIAWSAADEAWVVA
jgi:hypothetical protein